MMATASAVAFIVFSCKGKLSEAEDMDISQAPVQAVDSIFMTQSDKGILQMRAVAPRMERYDNDTASFEYETPSLAAFAARFETVMSAFPW